MHVHDPGLIPSTRFGPWSTELSAYGTTRCWPQNRTTTRKESLFPKVLFSVVIWGHTQNKCSGLIPGSAQRSLLVVGAFGSYDMLGIKTGLAACKLNTLSPLSYLFNSPGGSGRLDGPVGLESNLLAARPPPSSVSSCSQHFVGLSWAGLGWLSSPSLSFGSAG